MASSSRLAAVVGAGPFRLAVPAGEVLEVARLEAGVARVRDQPVTALATALGAPAGALGWALRLTQAEAPALGVESVEGVLELAGATTYHLPAVVGPRPSELLRGAVTVAERLALELNCAALLATLGQDESPPPPWPIASASDPAERALIVVIGGRSIGFSLPYVLSVLAEPKISPVPRVPRGQRGVVLHAQTLCPVIDVGEVLFQRPTVGAFGVVIDMAGTTWVVLADSVLGVRAGFKPTAGDQPGWMESARGERAFFPLFPSDADGLNPVAPA